jgi:hypothetical protein
MTIDWQFISQQEGGQKLAGYIPTGSSASGVTIATGFDIGQRSRSDIQRIPIAQSLKAKLLPYAGLTRQNAVTALRQLPLSVTRGDADSIDRAIRNVILTTLRRNYNAALGANSGLAKFDQLPKEAQTVIASLTFQYADLKRKTPRIWGLFV